MMCKTQKMRPTMCSDLKISVEVGAGFPKLIARSRTQSESWSVPLSSRDQIDKIMRLLATARDYIPKQVTGQVLPAKPDPSIDMWRE